MARSFADRAKRIASCCEGFNDASKGTSGVSSLKVRRRFAEQDAPQLGQTIARRRPRSFQSRQLFLPCRFIGGQVEPIGRGAFVVARRFIKGDAQLHAIAFADEPRQPSPSLLPVAERRIGVPGPRRFHGNCSVGCAWRASRCSDHQAPTPRGDHQSRQASPERSVADC